ncbi:aminotransferase class IV [Nitratifractor sp.]
MCRFFETIRIEEGRAWNLSRHEARMNRTRREVFAESKPLFLGPWIGELPKEGLYRCRIVYDRELRSMELIPYLPRRIESFRLLESAIEYPHKSCDRSGIDRLFAARGSADEILIVGPDGRLKDTSIANVALKLDGVWWTPTEPLLPGTMRERLLDAGKLKERELQIDDLNAIESFGVMNAMIGFYEIRTPRFYLVRQ